MGTWLNPPGTMFERAIRSEIYIDKTQLISFTNNKLGTMQNCLCVSRPRRFGKTVATNMLSAYYSCGDETGALFNGLKIQQNPSYAEHLNRYNVVKVDMLTFVSRAASIADCVELLENNLLKELRQEYPDIPMADDDLLSDVFATVATESGKPFIFLIDEWDCVMRRIRNLDEQKLYLEFLRNLLKDQPYVALAYMTGILPIRKYGEHSALNMFIEYSMTESGEISDCFGFTEEEVQELCPLYDMSFEEVKSWYDGYHLIVRRPVRKEYSLYSPLSVSEAMFRGFCTTFWNQTETYEALKMHIQHNFDGLRDAIVEMLTGKTVSVNTLRFSNEMFTYHSRDEVLTLLIHLGYLAYDFETKTVRIPNKEVAQEFINSIETMDSYDEVVASIQASKELLEALWNLDGDTVAAGVERAHMQFPSIKYNNENALSCVIELAFYYAREYYTVIREMPTGKGFADICYIPRTKFADKPAIIVELKWDKSVDAAIQQIKRKEYPAALSDWHGNLLLCGISYNRETDKEHQCLIEKFVK